MAARSTLLLLAACWIASVASILFNTSSHSVSARINENSQYALPLPRVAKGFIYSALPLADSSCDGVLDFIALFNPLDKSVLDNQSGDFGVRVMKLGKEWNATASMSSFTSLPWPHHQPAAIVAPLAIAMDVLGTSFQLCFLLFFMIQLLCRRSGQFRDSRPSIGHSRASSWSSPLLADIMRCGLHEPWGTSDYPVGYCAS